MMMVMMLLLVEVMMVLLLMLSILRISSQSCEGRKQATMCLVRDFVTLQRVG